MRDTWAKTDDPRRALGLVLGAVLALALGAGTVLAAVPQPQDPQPLDPQPGAGDLDPGLSVRYYRAFFRLIEEFDEWMADDEGEAGAPLPALDYRVAGGAVLTGGVEDGVGAKITGLIRLDKPGTYSLLVQSNDGFILDIGGVPVLEDPDVHGDRYSKIAKLTVERPGWYALYLLYFERKGTATLELYWKQPGDEAGAMALVPAEAFAHLEAD